jgi:hypothetical protein
MWGAIPHPRYHFSVRTAFFGVPRPKGCDMASHGPKIDSASEVAPLAHNGVTSRLGEYGACRN